MNIIKIVLLPLVRHGLNAACVLLISKGLTDQAGAAQLNGLAETITGIILASLNLGWSILEKHFTHKQLSDQSPGTPPK